MKMPAELISELVKVTSPSTRSKKESTEYGTIVEQDGTKFVQLDGSTLLTPVIAAADAKAGERVVVMIKNHTAVVTGNMTSPAARTGDVVETQGNVASVGKRVAKLETDFSSVSGFIVEESGESGIWTYEKLQNGKVELRGVYPVSNLACTTALGVLYRTNAIIFDDFPFTVTDPVTFVSYESDGYGAMLYPVTAATSAKPPSYYLVCPTSNTIVSGKIHIHVTGKWKT